MRVVCSPIVVVANWTNTISTKKIAPKSKLTCLCNLIIYQTLFDAIILHKVALTAVCRGSKSDKGGGGISKSSTIVVSHVSSVSFQLLQQSQNSRRSDQICYRISIMLMKFSCSLQDTTVQYNAHSTATIWSRFLRRFFFEKRRSKKWNWKLKSGQTSSDFEAKLRLFSKNEKRRRLSNWYVINTVKKQNNKHKTISSQSHTAD